MYIDANVVKVNDNGSVILSQNCQRECGNCKGSFFCKQKDTTFEATSGSLKLQKGEHVRVYLPKGKTILSTVLVFIVPLLFMSVFILLGGLSVINELLSGVLALVSLFLSFGILFLVNKKNKDKLMPIVKEVYEP